MTTLTTQSEMLASLEPQDREMRLLVSHTEPFPRTPGTVVRLAAVITTVLVLGIHWSFAGEPSGARRIGYLTMDSAALHKPFARAFSDGLREVGYIAGQNVTIVWRFAANDPNVLPHLSVELVDARVDVLVVDGTQAAIAAKRATGIIPIVFVVAADPVGSGLVDSLARPGGNITGLTLISQDLIGKRLAVLKEMMPRIRRVGVVVNPDNPTCEFQFREAQAVAPSLELELDSISVRRPEEIERVFQPFAGRVDALLLTGDVMLDGARTRIGAFAIKNRLPSICSYRMPEDKTCLMWYGPDLLQMFRRAASYVGRILNGTKPADLPVEQPARLTLVINGKTASALKIVIPQSLRVAADEIIP